MNIVLNLCLVFFADDIFADSAMSKKPVAKTGQAVKTTPKSSGKKLATPKSIFDDDVSDIFDDPLNAMK